MLGLTLNALVVVVGSTVMRRSLETQTSDSELATQN